MSEYEQQIIEELITAVETLRDEATSAGLVYTFSGIDAALRSAKELIDNK